MSTPSDPSIPDTLRREAHPDSRRFARILWPMALVITIFFGSGQGQVAAPSFVPSVDKLAHFGAFGLLATLVLRIFFDERRPWRTAFLAASCASLYGIADEFRQSFTPGRSVEVADWIADTTGAALAVWLYSFWGAWRRFLEYPLGLRSAKRGSGLASSPRSADVVDPISAR